MGWNRLPLLLGACFSWPVLAGTLHAPQTCSPKELSLIALNSSNEERVFWLQIFDHGQVEEIPQELGPQEQKKFAGIGFLRPGQTFAVRSFAKDLSFVLSCQGLLRMNEITSPAIEFELRGERGPFRLLHENLHPTVGHFQVRILDAENKTIHELTSETGESHQSRELIFRVPAEATHLQVRSVGRQSVQLLDQRTGRAWPVQAGTPLKVAAPKEKRYFLLSNREQSESFVAALDDGPLAQQAEDILQGQQEKLLIAEIEPAAIPGINRNFSAADRSPWSWQIARPKEFADFGAIDCDGSPSLVEDRFVTWMRLNPRRICFWNYRLQRELTPAEVSRGILDPQRR